MSAGNIGFCGVSFSAVYPWEIQIILVNKTHKVAKKNNNKKKILSQPTSICGSIHFY